MYPNQNKKGQFELRKVIYWTIAGFVITMLVLTFSFTIAGYKNKLVHVPPKLSSTFIALRFTNVQECFAVEEEGIVIPGSIDSDKFTKERLNQCYATEEKKGFKTFNFRLQLESTSEELITNNYFHHDKDDLTLFKEVLVKRHDYLEKDRLIIYVQEKIGK